VREQSEPLSHQTVAHNRPKDGAHRPDDAAGGAANLTYTATIANAGPSTATGLTLVANLPADAAFASATGAACTRAGTRPRNGTLTCTLGALSPGASATVTLVVQSCWVTLVCSPGPEHARGTSADRLDTEPAASSSVPRADVVGEHAPCRRSFKVCRSVGAIPGESGLEVAGATSAAQPSVAGPRGNAGCVGLPLGAGGRLGVSPSWDTRPHG
jgi:uncharacterized repeat protein (TIGR01451 family)